ncbi:hypothetical protein BN1708_020089, partial [Verticillium longisporum]
PLSCGLQF